MSSDMTDLAPAESILCLFGLRWNILVLGKWYISLVAWLGVHYFTRITSIYISRLYEYDVPLLHILKNYRFLPGSKETCQWVRS
jgi:hypothetical protein